MGLIVRASVARRDVEFERQRVISHELAGLIAVGFHDPKNLREYKPLAKKRTKAEASTPLDDEQARGYLMLLAIRGSK